MHGVFRLTKDVERLGHPQLFLAALLYSCRQHAGKQMCSRFLRAHRAFDSAFYTHSSWYRPSSPPLFEVKFL